MKIQNKLKGWYFVFFTWRGKLRDYIEILGSTELTGTKAALLHSQRKRRIDKLLIKVTEVQSHIDKEIPKSVFEMEDYEDLMKSRVKKSSRVDYAKLCQDWHVSTVASTLLWLLICVSSP